jgi:hypothetical protein
MDRNLSINHENVAVAKSADGTLTLSAPIVSAEFGAEGTFTFTLTNDMRLSMLWDGTGLTTFEAWSTQ